MKTYLKPLKRDNKAKEEETHYIILLRFTILGNVLSTFLKI